MLRAARWATLAIFLCLAACHASAQCSPLLCSLTFSLQSDASGLTLGGSGTAMASMAFGNMQAFGGSLPTGVTKNVGASNWTISTPFDVKVTCTNLILIQPCLAVLSPSYSLSVQLQSSDSTNTWKVGGSTVNSSGQTVLTTSGTYGQPTAYTFALTIPFTEAAGTIGNTLNFLAVAN